MNDYLDMFIEESSENLEQLEAGLMRLETQSGETSLATIRELFRFAHNLKGMAATVGQEGITTLAHRMEDLLDLFRNELANPTPDAVDELLAGTDAISSMLPSVPSGAIPAAPADLLAKLEARIAALTDDQEEEPAASPEAAPPAVFAEEIAVAPGRVRFEVDLASGTTLPGARAAVILNLVSSAGEIHTVSPDRERVLAGQASFFSIEATVSDPEPVFVKIERLSDVASARMIRGGASDASARTRAGAIRLEITLKPECALPGARAAVIFNAIKAVGTINAFSPEQETILAGRAKTFIIDITTETPLSLIERLGSLSDVASVREPEAEGRADDTPRDEKTGTASGPARQTVRVEVERLDALMNLVGELVIGRGQLEQRSRTLGDRSLGDVVTSLSRTISDIQAAVARARMITLEGTFSRLTRLVRDTSRELGKEIDFTLDGAETELDRSMIDKVADPLVHLLRNALDHGIETAEERAAAGKRRQGRIALSARTEGNQVIITVEDDGAGIDTDRVIFKALSRGIVTPEQVAQMSEDDKQNLVFVPGFSTRDKASAVSGRGVGMDVVRSSVTELGGSVDLVSQQGQGSTFRIRLPLSLAVLDVLLVSICDQTWAIPLQHVEETISVEAGDIGGVLGSPVITIRGETIGLIHGSRIIGHQAPLEVPFQAVVFRHRNDRWALSVDSLLEQAEVVVKPSPDELSDVPHVAGATILGDGRVSMILDLIAIVTNLTKEALRHVS